MCKISNYIDLAGIDQSAYWWTKVWTAEVRFPVGARYFSLLHSVQTGSGAHPASYPMGTGFSFSGGKAAGKWSRPLTSI
jgi:hypothetical protein